MARKTCYCKLRPFGTHISLLGDYGTCSVVSVNFEIAAAFLDIDTLFQFQELEWDMQGTMFVFYDQMTPSMRCTHYQHRFSFHQYRTVTTTIFWKGHLHDPRLRIAQFRVPRDGIRATRWNRRRPFQVQTEEVASLLDDFIVALLVRIRWRCPGYRLRSGSSTTCC